MSIKSSIPPFTTTPNNFYIFEAEARIIVNEGTVNEGSITHRDRVNVTITYSDLLVTLKGGNRLVGYSK